MDRTVPSNCLGNTQSTRCLIWEGPPYPELNIQTGDSLEYVLDQIVANLNTTPDLSPPALDMSCLVNSGTSECAALISQRDLSIVTTSATGGVTVLWNSDSIANGLPPEYSISAAQVLIRGKDGSSQYSGGNRSGQIAIPLGVFPVTMDYTLYVHTTCGSIRLTQSFLVHADPTTAIVSLVLIDVATAASQVTSYQQAIELLAREVCALKNSI